MTPCEQYSSTITNQNKENSQYVLEREREGVQENEEDDKDAVGEEFVSTLRFQSRPSMYGLRLPANTFM